jgi:flagellar basal-body rod protein FlgF
MMAPIRPFTPNTARLPWTWGGSYQGDGMGITVQGMMTNMAVMTTHANNVAYVNVPGYQAKAVHIHAATNQPFLEVLNATQSLKHSTNTQVGRIRYTSYPYDLALEQEGYFQRFDPRTGRMILTRDGRMRLDGQGHLVGADGSYFLTRDGKPFVLKHLLQDPRNQMKISTEGEITLVHPFKNETVKAGVISVLRQDGRTVQESPRVMQGFIEDSNVMLQAEFTEIFPQKRYFEANRQMFLTNSDLMNRMVQELGRAQ